jgi:phosphatidylglycerol:prolipoprotein diacylglycerol transferase
MHSVAVQFGSFSITWYAVAYGISLGITGWILWKILRRGGIVHSVDQWLDLMIGIVTGVVIGGRLGFVLLYQPRWFWAHPVQIMWPFDGHGVWMGIAGMSFHGGLIGVGIGLWWFARTYRVNWWYMADVGAFLAPIGSFFGRLANFANGELYGRVTTSWWGMEFPRGGQALRFPSQLFEALGEGLLVFGIVWYVRRRFPAGTGALVATYCVSYGIIRFAIEFFREPDAGARLFFRDTITFGQLLCIIMIVTGGALWRFRKNSVILKTFESK